MELLVFFDRSATFYRAAAAEPNECIPECAAVMHWQWCAWKWMQADLWSGSFVLFCFVFLRKECFHLYCCCLDSRCVSCSVTDCVLACLFVCLWVVMHVAMQFPCLSTMCFCLWEWWIEGRQLMWFRCSTRSVCSAARACVRALSTCVQPNLQCTCVFVCLPPSSPLFHSSSCTPPTRYHFFLMLCSFWTRSK